MAMTFNGTISFTPEGGQNTEVTWRIEGDTGTASNGAIAFGDLLVIADLTVYAMLATNPVRSMMGAMLSKAIDPLPSGEGIIRVLVNLQ